MNGELKMSKPLSQAAIGRALGLAASTVTKHKLAGMPVDSVESARAWHKAHTNIAQRKPASRMMAAQASALPVGQPPFEAARPEHPRMGGDDFPAMIRANEVRFEGEEFGEDFDSARTREKISDANMKKIEEDRLREKFLIKNDFERYLFNAGRMLRDTLTNCARRIGAEVSGLATAEECEAVIDREHRAALASYAQALRHTLKIEVESNLLNAPMETKK